MPVYPLLLQVCRCKSAAKLYCRGIHQQLYVLMLQTNGAVRPIIRKKAALCLLRLLRKAGPDSDMLAPDQWSVKLVRSPYKSCPVIMYSRCKTGFNNMWSLKCMLHTCAFLVLWLATIMQRHHRHPAKSDCCLLVLYNVVNMWYPVQGGLLEERDLGVLMAVVTLLLGIVSRNYEGAPFTGNWPNSNDTAALGAMQSPKLMVV